MARILVIDDEDPIRRMLRSTLESAGYEVVEARHGREGIALYRASPADLVITDILMSEKEGLESIIELRREFPTVKVIAMSGGSMRMNLDLLDIAERLGARRTFKKPFALGDLLAAVRGELRD